MGRSLFDRHLATAVAAYPSLSIIVDESGQRYLRGILDVPDGAGGVAISYLVEIKGTYLYPYRYPLAYDVGGDIPPGADNHKYGDTCLCLGVDAEEIIACRKGKYIVDFIREVLIPHLANQYYHRLTGAYLQEYAHGAVGIRQCYEKLLCPYDEVVWKGMYQAAFVKSVGRNDPCFCGSGRKFKCCHETMVETLRLIGKEQVTIDYTIMGLL